MNYECDIDYDPKNGWPSDHLGVPSENNVTMRNLRKLQERRSMTGAERVGRAIGIAWWLGFALFVGTMIVIGLAS